MFNLIDIYDDIKITNNNYFDEKEENDFIENILEMIFYFINYYNINEKSFNTFYRDFIELIFINLENEIWFNLNDENHNYIENLLDYCYELFKILFYNKNDNDETNYEDNSEKDDYSDDATLYGVKDNDNEDAMIYEIKENIKKYEIKIENEEKEKNDIELLEKQIEYLRNVIQPVQRTKEWYECRNNLLTASNAYKALGTQTDINSLIYEKCSSVKSFKNNNINSPLHFGQKYEPLSVMFYEKIYETKIEDFGCITHKIYKFLGASPDGINVNKNSNLYGRMLEIKNVVSRTINGIPKKEYWIQMQLQMECCDLNETDFLETKFIEYETKEDYDEDGDFSLSKDNKYKGTILMFYKNGNPYYEYKPINIKKIDEYEKWYNLTIDKNNDKTFIKELYWKLITFSCILVKRDKEWFNKNIEQFKNIWTIILEERINGEYIKRIPKKKIKIQKITSNI